MSMSMNIHNVASIKLGDIKTMCRSDGTVFSTRELIITGSDGKEILCLNPFSDDGYNLLVSDDELAGMMEEPTLLKAA